ncbi:MAG TPA: hypothetical protein VHG89_09495, partial [Verrucomicrobiae bacterium]|nr:hypothetical protein [Verrucomicrobiae bacterium]
MQKVLVNLTLIKKSFFRLKNPCAQNPNQTAVGPINAKNTNAARRHSQIKKTRLHAEPGRVGQQSNCERVFKGFFNFPLSQRTIRFKRRVIPIELHNELAVNKTPMQCIYF